MAIVLFSTDDDDFEKVIKENKEDDIKEYIIRKGKKPKNTCPICFYDKEYLDSINNKNSKEDN